ncbi:alpha/beta hydrolase [Deinococcus sp. HMF7604]|uniref:alpha/beta hydrolase n=1 Tax=Deinococcus betulae TaxID=2873312 RepID=UPI001CCEB7D5|nr:alpha/beta hydrolase-fold protein [Deinococcus betulae]MBZ9750704.1 alpha/beta hydrolase [Deinococcus betulae]
MPRMVFRLRLPHGSPPAQTLFLTGDHRGWSSDPEGWTFTAAGELAADLPMGALTGVKVRARHSDGTVTEEGDAWGGRAPAHKVVVSGETVIQLEVAGWQDARAGQGRPARSAPPREAITLAAPWGDQAVRLWWPAGHDTGPLPLLILHDGQNVFDEGPTFAGESWDAAGAAQTLADAGLPCRVAALPVGDDRSRRYVPSPFELNGFVSGADEYADWLKDFLLPQLLVRFGSVPASQVALAGSSFGGLITAYCGLRDPSTYGTLGVFSPAVWPADFAFLRWQQGHRAPQARVWLDMGDHEGSSLASAAETVALAQTLAETLRPQVQEVQFVVGGGHWHDEAAWRARLPGFLHWWLGGLTPVSP